VSDFFGFALIIVVLGTVAFVVTRSRRDIKGFMASDRKAAQAGPAVLPRSSASELPDAGAYEWPSVLQALFVAPDAVGPDGPDDDEYASNLGLRMRLGSMGSPGTAGDANSANVMHGTRQGRPVEVRLGKDEKIAAINTGTKHLREITFVGAHCPSFELRGVGGQLVADGELPAPAREVLSALAPAEVWSGVRIVAGEEGLVANRPQREGPYGWVYDLWLLERLANHLNASATTAHKRWTITKLPYGMGSWTA
jgi:hypothetical protein